MTWKTSFEKQKAFAAFSWQLRRMLPLAAVYWAGFLLVCLWNSYTMRPEHLVVCNFLAIGYSFLLPAWLLGDCFSRKQADFIHALPVNRSTFFVSSMGVGLLTLWAPIPILGLRDWLYGPVDYNRPFLQSALIMALMGACVLAFFTLAAVASGTYFEYTLTAVLLTFGWWIMMYYLFSIIYITIPGGQYQYWPEDYFVRAGSPPMAMFLSHMRGWRNWDMAHQLPCKAVLIPPLLALSWFVYCRRGSEKSGISRHNKGMRLYLRVQLAVTAAMWASAGLCDRQRYFPDGDAGIPKNLGAMAAALLGAWVVTEVYYFHSLKKLHRHLLPLALSFAVTAGAIGAISTGLGVDTKLPDLESLAGVSFPIGSLGDYTISVNTHTDGAQLYPGVMSPENMEKALQLQAKWIEAERAAQYPYLPGRNGYDSGDYTGFTYHELGAYIRIYYYSFLSKKTPEAQRLLDEYNAMLLELASCEEAVESAFPLNALDALEKIGKGDMPPHTVIQQQNPEEAVDAKELEEFPAGFLEKLEDAMREDFRAGRFPKAGYEDPYLLHYDSTATILAKGGILVEQYPAYRTIPAKGRVLPLAHQYAQPWDTVFAVTPEMTSTYALLEKEYK